MHTGYPTQTSAYRRARLVSVLCFCAQAGVQTTPASGQIHRCESAGRPVLYTQFLCPEGNTSAPFEPDVHSIVRIPGLSAEETAALADLEKSLHQERITAQRTRQAQRRQQLKASASSAKLCRAAIAGLERIRERKRHGYSAAEEHELERERRTLAAQKKANC